MFMECHKLVTEYQKSHPHRFPVPTDYKHITYTDTQRTSAEGKLSIV